MIFFLLLIIGSFLLVILLSPISMDEPIEKVAYHPDGHATVDGFWRFSLSSCHLCREIVKNVHEGTVHEERPFCKVQDLDQSGNKCLFCHDILDACDFWRQQQINTSPLPQDRARSINLRTYIERGNYVLEFLNDDRSLPRISGIVIAFTDTEKECPSAILYLELESRIPDSELERDGSIYSIERDPLSRGAVETVKKWLENCQSNHSQPLCRERSTTTPTRLLDVRTEGMVKLVTKPSGGPYVALSHCWGGPIPTKTTAENLQALFCGVPISKYPQNFIDAIQLTRSLGFSYLWIDSLCIIQDDMEDWAKESGEMASVYKGATLTISASRSKSATEGFLRPREPNWQSGYLLKTAKPLRFKYYTLRKRTSDNFRRYLNCEPVERRAWCLQESHLSRRIVYYAERMAIWECSTCTIGENRRPETQWKPTVWERSNSPITSWYHVVGEYCRRDLTKASDKLPALSGLAQSFHEYQLSRGLCDKYHAGLWESDIIKGLLWLNNSQVYHRPSNDPYRVPTWSWAFYSNSWGINFPLLTFPLHKEPEDCTILALCKKVITFPSTADPFGQVSYGEITLSSSCCENFTGGVIEFKNNNETMPSTGEYQTKHGAAIFQFDTNSHSYIEKEGLLFLRMVQRQDIVWGLILDPVEAGKYQRLGLYSEKIKKPFDDDRIVTVTVI